ncbi:hypothetical protein EX30DRAFT_383898 [Ascodesmis nigricans]|uniref:Uncharacterized protein n=1 Tax=Ascodesmis nigricans TaxID=341454 RepID=A0A4S2N123_9PEZI|nr:hypothetical protein EX30DRAFT_383898 [Ascodesmis nigricans]
MVSPHRGLLGLQDSKDIPGWNTQICPQYRLDTFSKGALWMVVLRGTRYSCHELGPPAPDPLHLLNDAVCQLHYSQAIISTERFRSHYDTEEFLSLLPTPPSRLDDSLSSTSRPPLHTFSSAPRETKAAPVMRRVRPSSTHDMKDPGEDLAAVLSRRSRPSFATSKIHDKNRSIRHATGASDTVVRNLLAPTFLLENHAYECVGVTSANSGHSYAVNAV